MSAHVVIVGGGFAGLQAAKALSRLPVRVTLVDRRNFHLFQPLLYQVAMAGLSPGNIAAPLRAILRRSQRVQVLLGEVMDIEPDARQLILGDGNTLGYDYLIVATGSSHSYFGHSEWAHHAPGLKTVEDALEIRRRVLLAFEEAERVADPEERQAWLTFVVVGAGPTGLELAGALAEMARHTLRGDFRSIDPASARVILLEAMDRVLPPFPPDLSAKAEASLDDLGVTVQTNTMVVGLDEQSVTVRRNEHEDVIPARTVLWAAGVQASALGKVIQAKGGAELDRAGRIKVAPDLSVPGYPNVFIAGDLAHFAHGLERPLPGLAPVAMQQGTYLADVIRARLENRAVPPFHYRDRGTMATIGRAAAVAELGPLRLSGLIAWLSWLFIHLMYLVGFDNRVMVLMQWTWSYLTYTRSARLIVGDIESSQAS